ncbi:aminotransferase-like domain-containing protein [Rubinisphaera italica]|uniref:2-aminoadipate transaminase n=1 Tax=Rubinisphaera italica TaxID=2527969 RepID=A0A5C5XNC9_9PLAN|nr:PLP-dependent aminotransferase family protein [Rubinisphaera italica]TWT63873.1 2-aminoadipate transaminase [Rubinisphaera italica]
MAFPSSNRGQWAGRQQIGYLMQQGVDYPNCLSLAAGLVDYDTFPADLVLQATQKILTDPAQARASLQYGTTPGSLELRRQLLKHLAKLDGVSQESEAGSIDQLLITTGSQQFLDLVSQAVLNPGDICLVTAPSYFVYLSTLEGIGVELVSVDCDDQGIIPASLQETLERLEQAGKLPLVKMLYLVSYFDNPRGITMPLNRRQEVLEILERWSAKQYLYLLEDAAYRELWFEEPPPQSIYSLDQSKERVIYTQTFSKSLSPGLRTGFGLLPKALVKPVTDLKSIHDFGSPHFSQFVVSELLSSGQYEQHVKKLRESYREKSQVMWNAVSDSILTSDLAHAEQPGGGLYVWLKLDDKVCDTRFSQRLFRDAAEKHHVMFVPGELFYSDPSHPDANLTMRLSYGVQTQQKLKEGIERLANAIAEVRK